MRWMQVAIKPAKPFAFGVLEKSETPVFGLPGNPVSALVSYELFVRPALRSMAGCSVLDRPRLSAVAEVDLPRRPDGKLHLMRVTARTGADGELGVRTVGGQDSHMLHVMAQSNALALVPDGDGVRAGQRVQVLLLDADGVPVTVASRCEPGRRGVARRALRALARHPAVDPADPVDAGCVLLGPVLTDAVSPLAA